MTLRSFLASAAALLFSAPSSLAQCAMCKEALESGSKEGLNLSRGIAWSIFLLFGMLLTMTGGIVYLIVKNGRTTPAPTTTPEGSAPSPPPE